MRLFISLLIFIPTLSWGDFDNYKKYVDSLSDPIQKSVTCMRFWDIFAAGTEIKIYDLFRSNQKDEAENLLSSFYEMKRRAIFIDYLAKKYNYEDIMDISYDLGANTDYFSENVRSFIEPICTNEINKLMKTEDLLTNTAKEDTKTYIDNLLKKL